MMSSLRGSLTIHIISVPGDSVVNALMYAKRLSFVTSTVHPVSNATRSVNLLPKNSAAGWTKHLMSAMDVKKLKADAPSPTNILMMQSLHSAGMNSSVPVQEKA